MSAVRVGTFWVYYYDPQGLPATHVTVHVNGAAHAMQPDGEADYSRPVRYTCELTITEPRNDYSFTASNGKQARTVPGDYQLPGPFLAE